MFVGDDHILTKIESSDIEKKIIEEKIKSRSERNL